MKLFRRVAAVAATSAASAMGFEKELAIAESSAAYSIQDSEETTAPPALIDVPVNRETRRRLGLEKGKLFVSLPADSIQLSDFEAAVSGINAAMQQRSRSIGETTL